LEDYLKPLNLDQTLPWDFIDVGVNKEFLKDKNPILRNSDIIAIFPPVSGG